MSQIDPIARALRDFYDLSDEGKRVFLLSVGQIEAFSKGYIATTEEPKPKRGRPPGSKNRKPADVTSQDDIQLVERLFGNNGATEEGL